MQLRPANIFFLLLVLIVLCETVSAQNTYNDFIVKKGENIPAKISKNIFITVEANKTSCYIGEPVEVTYKLFTRLKSVSSIIKQPSFNGFSVIDLSQPGDNRYVVEELNGRAYNVYTLRRAQLYPLQQGNIALEPASVENDIRFIKEENIDSNNPDADFFGEYIPRGLPAEAILNEKVTLQSKPLMIRVKVLPEEKKPASFNGAVGNFTILAEVGKNYFTTDDAGRLRIIISGEGNLTLVNAPDLAWPAGIEAFEPTVKDELNKLSVPVSGNKIFEYVFNIDKAGSYTLPAATYSFFDAAIGLYKTISTKPIHISVAKGSGIKPILPVSENISTRERFFETMFNKRWLIIVPVALLILAGLFFWLKADEKMQRAMIARNKGEEKDTAGALPLLYKNPLAKTEELLQKNNAREFYTTLNKELRIFLAAKLQLEPENVNKKSIAGGLDTFAVPVGVCISIHELLDEISLQLYTPFADETNMQECYQKAIAAVHAFGKTAI